jgi:hypothetical protein
MAPAIRTRATTKVARTHLGDRLLIPRLRSMVVPGVPRYEPRSRERGLAALRV